MSRRRIRTELRKIRAERPGERFEATHERHRIANHAIRVTVIAIGCGVMVAAAFTFWVPGPNFVVVLAGLALVAGQWRGAARLLDRGEVAVRRWHDHVWEPLPRRRKLVVLTIAWLVGASIAVAMFALAWRAGLLPFA